MKREIIRGMNVGSEAAKSPLQKNRIADKCIPQTAADLESSLMMRIKQ